MTTNDSEPASAPRMSPAAAAAGSWKDVVLAEGRYTIRREAHEALAGATGDQGHAGATPHPGLAMVATLAATGVSIEELLQLCGSSIAAGPMLGECRVGFRRELRFDVEYTVSRRILAVEHKKSRRFGAMDLLRFVAHLHEPAGEIVADVTYTWVLPKRSGT